MCVTKQQAVLMKADEGVNWIRRWNTGGQ